MNCFLPAILPPTGHNSWQALFTRTLGRSAAPMAGLLLVLVAGMAITAAASTAASTGLPATAQNVNGSKQSVSVKTMPVSSCESQHC